MTTFCFVRHATTAATGTRIGGRTEAPLDERGRDQAGRCAERLAELPVKAVYASPLRRTTETARIVAAPHDREVRVCDGVIEVDYGRWTDRPLGGLARTKLWPVIQLRPSRVVFPDGETIRGAQTRAVDAVEELVASHRSQLVVVVSHADIIKLVVASFLGGPLDLFQRIEISPASTTILDVPGDGGRPTLLRLNDDGPLDASQFRRRRSRKAASKGSRRG